MRYKNIAISGGIGVGNTTLLKNLKSALGPEWKCTSTGQMFREMTKENVMPVSTLVDDETDRKIEAETLRRLRNEEHWVIDGWLAGFISRDVPHVLRVLMVCSDFDIRVDRVSNRDDISIQEAKNNILTREEENFAKWRRIYGDYNFFDPSFFNLVIDTHYVDQHTAVNMVLQALNKE